jgi:hypothetical protein
MAASVFGIVASTQGLCLENLWQKEERLLYYHVECVFVLRTFGGEEDPNSSLFAVLGRFFIRARSTKNTKASECRRFEKHLPWSCYQKMIKIFRALASPLFSEYTRFGSSPSSPVGLYKQTGLWEVTTTFIAVAPLCYWKFNRSRNSLHCAFKQALRHLRSTSSKRSWHWNSQSKIVGD